MNMPNENIFTDQHCDIRLNDDKTLFVKMKGFIKYESIREIFPAIQSAIKKHKPSFLLIDETELKVLPKDTLEYMLHSLNNLEKLGLKKIATLEAHDIFGQASTDRLQSETRNRPITARRFRSEQDAMHWLNAIPESTI